MKEKWTAIEPVERRSETRQKKKGKMPVFFFSGLFCFLSFNTDNAKKKSVTTTYVVISVRLAWVVVVDDGLSLS